MINKQKEITIGDTVCLSHDYTSSVVFWDISLDPYGICKIKNGQIYLEDAREIVKFLNEFIDRSDEIRKLLEDRK